MPERTFDHDIMPEIKARWSPRAFDDSRPVTESDLLAMLEAAHYAPSCFNEQPWRFLIARTPEQRQKLVSVLTARNQEWAAKAPVLMLILACQNHAENQKPNRWHQFDTGTAWGFMALEAQRRGLVSHAMGGFSAARAREAFAIPEEYSILAAVAIGYYGDRHELSEEQQAREHPGTRDPVASILYEVE